MRIHLQQVHQSLSGSEHFMIDRAPQPPPRVIPGNNTNRNISDIVGIVNNPLPPPPPAALPTVVVPNTLGGMNPSIVNTPLVTTLASSITPPSVTLTPVPLNAACLSNTTPSTKAIGSVTLTPVNRPNSKAVNFITSDSNAEPQLPSVPHNSLPNISLPSEFSNSQSPSTITMISNSLPGMNLSSGTLNNSLSNPVQQPLQAHIEGRAPLSTSLTTTLSTLTLPTNFVSNLVNVSSTPIAMPTSTNSSINSMIQNLQPSAICTTNPVNHTILTNVLNHVSEASSIPPPTHQEALNPSTNPVQISHTQNSVLSNNVIPLIVTKIEENAVH